MATRPKGVKSPQSIAREFENAVRKGYLIPFLEGLRIELKKHPYLTTIGWIGIIDNYVTAWNRNKRARIPLESIRHWAEKADASHKRAFIADFRRAFKVDIRPVLNSAQIKSILEKSIEENVRLISTIDDRFKQSITDKYIKAEAQSPLDLQARERMFRVEGKSSGWNLRRITRDQSNKLTGQLTKARQGMAGIQEYEWDTSEDDRVRPTHVANHGRIFRWDLNDGKGPAETGHPGHDIQCRCVAIPKVVVEELQRRVNNR